MPMSRAAASKGNLVQVCALALWGTAVSCSAPNPLFEHGDGRRDAGSLSDVLAFDLGPAGDLGPGSDANLGGVSGAGGGGGAGVGGIDPNPYGTGGAGGTGGVDSGPQGGGGAGGGAGGAGGGDAAPDLPIVDAVADVGPPPVDQTTVPDVAPVDVGPACGTAHADLTGTTGVRGIAVDTDGTVFFVRDTGTQVWLGRVLPNLQPDLTWKSLPANLQPRTMRVDSQRHLLYVAGGAGVLYGFASDSGMIRTSSTGLPGAHGLTVGEGNWVYVSTSDGHIQRIYPDIVVTPRNQATIDPPFPAGQRVLGMALGPSGQLYVGSSNGGIKRLQVQGDRLVDPVDHGTFVGAAQDLAFDAEGRLFIADSFGTAARPLVQMPPGGGSVVPVPQVTGRPSAVAFGRGPIDCHDLYVGDAVGLVQRLLVLQPGLLR